MNWLRRLFIAISCVTSIPVSQTFKSASDIGGLSVYLPTVGLIIGLVLAGIQYLLNSNQTSALVSAAVITVLWIVISGGLHFDGLMDAADGIFSHRSRERMLEIMRDSRVGNFGVMTGMAVFAIKLACLAALPPKQLLPILILTPCWSRWCETLTIGIFNYCREEGLGKVWHDTTSVTDIVLAATIPVLALIACGSFAGFQLCLVISALVIFSGVAAGTYINHILGGHTGDTYGAVVELSEAGGLLFAALFLSRLS